MNHNPLNYSLALRRVLSLVDYERMTGPVTAPPKLDLSRMHDLVRRLAHPQRCAPVLHIAGTKGKGSVAAMAASIFSAAGMRVGLFTSPHLHTFRERIRVNGALVTHNTFATLVDSIWPHVESMALVDANGRPSTFELLTAMAFELFRDEQVDVQVLEVGLGGRLDSTNVANGEVAAITSLSLDHTNILGDNLRQIAAEKAGIIKPGAHVVLAPQEPEADALVEEVCSKNGASLWRIGVDVKWSSDNSDLAGQEMTVTTPVGTHSVRVPLLGAHQLENAAVAISAVEKFEFGRGKFNSEYIERGIRSVDWPGRFQVLAQKPFIVVDGAHNPQSMARLCEAVRDILHPQNTIVVFGCSFDKDLEGMVRELVPIATRVFVCESGHPRAVATEELQSAFAKEGIGVEVAERVGEALKLARTRAGDQDSILVTGSLFVVAEALQEWFGIEPERYPELDSSDARDSETKEPTRG